ncbi:MAG: ribosome silencing factor [Fimbriimonadales bacterium]|nr:ribosome silencing factor [Fimbriimonadales bacterium]MCS7190946.1 ribosome silencing factor [Fimbriimonadales bacterium]
MTTEQKRQRILDAAEDAKAERIVALDLRGKTLIADYFIVCSGNSDVHIRSIADKIQDTLRTEGERALRVEGYREATWVLLDYGDVVVHIMREETRQHYGLETFWQNAPLIESLREYTSDESRKRAGSEAGRD